MVIKRFLRRFVTVSVFMLTMLLLSSTKCSEEFEKQKIDFIVENGTNDTVVLRYKYKNDVKAEFTMPYDKVNNYPYHHVVSGNNSFYIHDEVMQKENFAEISADDALAVLENNVDSLFVTRKSDMKTILFTHSDNATEDEKYFFNKKAWKTHVGSELPDELFGLQDIRFIITNELFDRK